MKFLPFGYDFEIFSGLTPAEVKAEIRSKKTNIFDPKNGARGWIAGPFICLWFSAFDRYGPMLFGIISSDNLGTRIHGRAGSDLNGVVMFTALVPIMAWLVFIMISERQAFIGQIIVIALVFLVGGPLIYWSAHKERKSADPLVRFIRRVLSKSATPPKSKPSAREFKRGLCLILNRDRLEGPVTKEAIESAFMRVGDSDFLIIETAPHEYMQTMCKNGKYVLELRKGGPNEHYQAVRREASSSDCSRLAASFTFEEVNEAMASHASGAPLPTFLRLEPMTI